MTCIQFYGINKLIKVDYHETIITMRVMSRKTIILKILSRKSTHLLVFNKEIIIFTQNVNRHKSTIKLKCV